jgi:hypothetical protein
MNQMKATIHLKSSASPKGIEARSPDAIGNGEGTLGLLEQRQLLANEAIDDFSDSIGLVNETQPVQWPNMAIPWL